MIRENVIQKKSFSFALTVVELYKKLIDNREYVISKQILRSGTSIGANVEEGLGAFSRKDFIYKMSLASKEARETMYWLRILKESALAEIELNSYLQDCNEIILILTSIVKSAQSNQG